MGWNLEGSIKPSDKAYIAELEARLALFENKKQRKSKNKYDFSNILGEVPVGNRPWDF